MKFLKIMYVFLSSKVLFEGRIGEKSNFFYKYDFDLGLGTKGYML